MLSIEAATVDSTSTPGNKDIITPPMDVTRRSRARRRESGASTPIGVEPVSEKMRPPYYQGSGRPTGLIPVPASVRVSVGAQARAAAL